MEAEQLGNAIHIPVVGIRGQEFAGATAIERSQST
jgi:hypothetical protein